MIAYESNSLKIQDYQSAEALIEDIQLMLERCASIYYGIRAGLLSDDLIESVIAEIIKRFKSITIKDIEHSFERAVIVKEDWRNLTKREMIEPIQNWWNYKENIRIEFEKHQKEAEEIEAGKVKEEEFKNQSIIVYKESMLQLEWLGTVFQASAIAKDYISEHIEDKKRAELWNDAIRLFKEAKEKTKEQSKKKEVLIPANFGISTLKLYSELIVKEGIKQQIEIKLK